MPEAPDPVLLSLTGLGALAVNLSCALMLTRYRRHSGSLTRAAFLSARNDAVANVAIIAAGLATAFLWASAWPDLVVGLGIVALNADAAQEVWQAEREEHKTAEAQPPIILEFRIGGLTVCGRVFYISRSQSVSYLINSCWKTPQYCETDPS